MKHKLYLHKKTGNVYRLITAAKIEKDLSAAVVYTDHPSNDHVWIRPRLEFFDGRFQEIGEWDDGVFDPLGDIKQFHDRFDLDGNHPMGCLSADVCDFRMKFLSEEANEWYKHQTEAYDETTKPVEDRDQANYAYHLEHALDGLVDLIYVAFGTSYLHGFNGVFAEAWRRVHSANMQKVRADLDGSNSKRNSPHDVVKPAGWEPPVLSDLVEDNDIDQPHPDRK